MYFGVCRNIMQLYQFVSLQHVGTFLQPFTYGLKSLNGWVFNMYNSSDM